MRFQFIDEVMRFWFSNEVPRFWFGGGLLPPVGQVVRPHMPVQLARGEKLK